VCSLTTIYCGATNRRYSQFYVLNSTLHLVVLHKHARSWMHHSFTAQDRGWAQEACLTKEEATSSPA
jgi:hypothetical protein